MSALGYWYSVRPGPLFEYLVARYPDQFVENKVRLDTVKELIIRQIFEQQLFWPEQPQVRLNVELSVALGLTTFNLRSSTLETAIRQHMRRLPHQSSIHLWHEESESFRPYFRSDRWERNDHSNCDKP